MTSHWQPYRESLRVTVFRTGTIAVVLGAVLALLRGSLTHWPMAALLVLWFSFGGHWVELFFLNWLRPRLPIASTAQIVTRMGLWFVGSTILAIGMKLTADLLGYRPMNWPAWWIGGLAFIGLELVVHLFMHLRGIP